LPDRWYRAGYRAVLLIVVAATLFILWQTFPPEITAAFIQLMNRVGDPQYWVNASPKYRAEIAAVYYIFLLGSLGMFCLGLAKSPLTGWGKIIGELSLARKLAILVLFTPVFHYYFSGFGLDRPISVEDLATHRPTGIYFNTAAGIVGVEYVVLVAVSYLGIALRSVIEHVVTFCTEDSHPTRGVTVAGESGESPENSLKCPRCAQPMTTQGRWRCSLIDIAGATLVSSFVVWAGAKPFLWLLRLHGGRYSLSLLIVGVFLVTVMLRYFVNCRREKRGTCSSCGYHLPRLG
jgi:hypothetical protein